MYGITAEIVTGYASWFVGCWEYYAVQQPDGSYRPARCPLSLSVVASHLLGHVTLGTYVLDQWGRCSFAVLDADQQDGLERLAQVAAHLATQGVTTLLEASRRGGHLWVWFTEPVAASTVRAWLLPYARAAGVEVYPKQDALGPDGVGSLIRLPLGVHRRSGGWYPFVVPLHDGRWVPVGETVADCCLWVMAHAKRMRVPLVSTLDREVREAEERHRPGAEGVVLSALMAHSGPRGVIRAWCSQQEIRQVIGRYTQLDRRGVGRCPLPGHHRRGDVHPSLQVFAGHDPHWYCYTWGRAGTVFDFLCLYHGLSVQEAWERLQEGCLW